MSKNKRKKGLNANLIGLGERHDGKCKRILYYRKRDRVKNRVREFEYE